METYLKSGSSDEKKFALDLVRRGRTIVIYKVNGENHFAPSRFIGYKNNTQDRHISNLEKDGRETNPIISEIIGKYFQNPKTEQKFITYCESLGIVQTNNKRSFWRIKDTNGKNLDINI